MKIKLILLVCAALYLSAPSIGQVKLQYRSQNYTGLLEGEAKAAFQLQTIHGVQVGKWYTALGAGLDYYRYRTIPLFFTLNRDVPVGNRIFFVSGDIGTNLPWVTEQTYSIWSWPSEQDYQPGLYWAAGLGYKAFFKDKSNAIVLNLGYSFKNLKETQKTRLECFDPACSVSIDRFDYRMKRVSLRIGWQF